MTRRLRPLGCCSILMTALAVFAIEGHARCQATPRDIDALAKSTLVYIATVRKDGNQSKPTPVWFTTTADHMVCIETGPDSWKAKRIRRGSPAMIWIGFSDGPAFIGKAEITKDPAIENRIIEDYPEKYWEARVGLFKPTMEKFDGGKIVAIKIIPIRDLSEGFTSKPGTPAPSLEHGEPAPTSPSSAAP